jgi:hypothetical protein
MLGGIAAGQIDSNQKSRDIDPHDGDSWNPFHGKSANLQASPHRNAREVIANYPFADLENGSDPSGESMAG